MTGHHDRCPISTISGMRCGCSCHADTHKTYVLNLSNTNTQKDEDNMAQRVITTLEDDLDGSEASETIVFALDGKTYEIDLNDSHAAELREKLAPYLGAARKTSGGRVAVRRIGSAKPAADSGAIRTWARENGYEVNDRGRVPAPIREAYEKATAA